MDRQREMQFDQSWSGCGSARGGGVEASALRAELARLADAQRGELSDAGAAAAAAAAEIQRQRAAAEAAAERAASAESEAAEAVTVAEAAEAAAATAHRKLVAARQAAANSTKRPRR